MFVSTGVTENSMEAAMLVLGIESGFFGRAASKCS